MNVHCGDGGVGVGRREERKQPRHRRRLLNAPFLAMMSWKKMMVKIVPRWCRR